MKKINKGHLKDIFEREITYLINGIADASSPFHYFCLSTLSNENVSSRTVVLRRIDRDPLALYFNADFRSPKIKQLSNNNYCSILFYDNTRKIQIRANCEAFLNNKNKFAKETWNTTPLQSRKCYMGEYSPSDIISDWSPNIPIEFLKKDPTRTKSETAFKNFSVVKLKVINLDILELHHDGHIRFRVENKNNFYFIAP